MILINFREMLGRALCMAMLSFLFLGVVGLAGNVITTWIELFRLATRTVDPVSKKDNRGGPMKRIPPLFIKD